jgi:hypothetical protein
MIRPNVADLIAVNAAGKYYYALLLSKVRLFGAPLVFAFHRTSVEPLVADEIVKGNGPGFHEFVDFIWAKRENRVSRIASKIDTRPFDTVRRFKSTHTTKGKASLWFIYDQSFEEVRRTEQLTLEEKGYPLLHRIDDVLMCDLINQQWTPAKDERI